MGRIFNVWAALMGRPIYAGLPPARLLELGPKDQIILECERGLTKQQREQLRDYMVDWLDGSKRVAVLTGGLRLLAVRKKETHDND